MVAERIRAVLFDFHNTLGFDIDPRDAVAARVLSEFGYVLDPALVRDAQARAFGRVDVAEGIDHRAHSGSREAYTAYLLQLETPWLLQLGVDPRHPGLFSRLADEWDSPDRIRLFDDTIPALTELRDAGYRLGVVSNWSWGLHELLAINGIAPLLDVTVGSARAGYRKPHPAIYEQALRSLALPAAAVLFVGDSPHADIAGPRAAGMTPVHIDRFDLYEPLAGVPRIRGLDELPGLLKEL
jgi:putative hydrolase of the HAD superfamily